MGQPAQDCVPIVGPISDSHVTDELTNRLVLGLVSANKAKQQAAELQQLLVGVL